METSDTKEYIEILNQRINKLKIELTNLLIKINELIKKLINK